MELDEIIGKINTLKEYDIIEKFLIENNIYFSRGVYYYNITSNYNSILFFKESHCVILCKFEGFFIQQRDVSNLEIVKNMWVKTLSRSIKYEPKKDLIKKYFLGNVFLEN